MMSSNLPESAVRVQQALTNAGLAIDVLQMPGTTRTAREAAEAIGCTVSQIAKSLIFQRSHSKSAVLVVASGTNRVNEQRIEELCGEPLEKASPEFVRATTGYAIGGVPPLGFPSPIETLIDEDLLKYSEVWAAAGTPFSVFRIAPHLLQDLTGGKTLRIT
jgi:prolyl-tRNA editing enzyme YbaK/EbsC (Cys-tRNA(Pro) deacylase)